MKLRGRSSRWSSRRLHHVRTPAPNLPGPPPPPAKPESTETAYRQTSDLEPELKHLSLEGRVCFIRVVVAQLVMALASVATTTVTTTMRVCVCVITVVMLILLLLVILVMVTVHSAA